MLLSGLGFPLVGLGSRAVLKPESSNQSICMSLRSLKERFKSMQNGPLRGVVAVVATIEQSLRYQSPVRITVDQDGDWYNRRREVTFVAPELNVTSWANAENGVHKLWLFKYELKAGDTVIDIGAGIGDDAVVFSRLVGKEGRVVAIEAHPTTYRCLEKTIAANKLDNVVCLNVAVSNREGEVGISTMDNFLSNSILDDAGTRKVATCLLDDALERIGITKPDLIKMNIEGAETTALLGMPKTLATTPHVVISCHDFKCDRRENPAFRTFDDVQRIIADSGYRVSGGNEHLLPESHYYVYGEK